MGVTCELAPVNSLLVESIDMVESNGWNNVQHHAIRTTRTTSPYRELFTRGPYYFIAGGVSC